MSSPLENSRCQARRRSAATLGLCDAPGSNSHNRSYTVAANYPFAPFELVMETMPGTCDLYSYRARNFCCGMQTAATASAHTESHVRDALASLLGGQGCHTRPASRLCRAVDLGANNGWNTLMMLQLGASVVAVEPQPDLARALRESIELNCWSGRGKVINAMACAPPCPTQRLDFKNCENRGWRYGNMYGPSQLQKQHANAGDCAAAQGLPESVGGVALSTVLLSHSRLKSAGTAIFRAHLWLPIGCLSGRGRRRVLGSPAAPHPRGPAFLPQSGDTLVLPTSPRRAILQPKSSSLRWTPTGPRAPGSTSSIS